VKLVVIKVDFTFAVSFDPVVSHHIYRAHEIAYAAWMEFLDLKSANKVSLK